MKKEWGFMYAFERETAIKNCGWITRKNNLSPIGKKIIKTEWQSLSSAAQNVLLNHGYTA